MLVTGRGQLGGQVCQGGCRPRSWAGEVRSPSELGNEDRVWTAPQAAATLLSALGWPHLCRIWGVWPRQWGGQQFIQERGKLLSMKVRENQSTGKCRL